MRAEDRANRDRLVALAAESHDEAAKEEGTEEIIPAHAVATLARIKSTRR
jgi:hypothetical protein